MKLKAKPERTLVEAKEVNFNPQGIIDKSLVPPDQPGNIVYSEDAEYDSCFFEITLDEAILEKWDPTLLNIRITAKSEKMNAYIYEGRTREDSKKSLKVGNT